MDWKKESTMFNQTAEYYDKFRPSYPQEIVETIVTKTGINSDSKLLEIGAGSGKATELFVNKFNVMCIEPGDKLVEMGKRKFVNYDNIKFTLARFEEYDVENNQYDLVFSAQAFHWVPQPIGFQKCAQTLKEKGFLALFWNMYMTLENSHDTELVNLSKRYGGFADFLSENDCEKRIQSISNGIVESNLFAYPKVYRFKWKQSYTPDEYFGFILTGNSFVQKTDIEKESAYKDIVELAKKNKGYIEQQYLSALYLTEKI